MLMMLLYAVFKFLLMLMMLFTHLWPRPADADDAFHPYSAKPADAHDAFYLFSHKSR